MIHRRWQATLWMTTIIVTAMIGCARLDYVKVPVRSQYDKWNDEHQREADGMKGVRYYLPRPYLHLKQSIPVAQRVALVSFRYDPNEKAYCLVPPMTPPTWLLKVVPQRVSVSQALALVAAGESTGQTRGSLQGTTAGGKEATDAVGSATKPATETPPSELHARTGFINTTDPVTRLGDRFDVVYLPDFEEQYVIQPHPGLGKADIETQLRNGWAAEVFSQQVDNSNLIPYVINQFEKASDAAAGIVTTWAPLAAGLPVGKLPSLGKLQGKAAGEAEPDKARQFLGDVLLFKIAEVKVAQPGLYPILKPQEMRQWLKADRVIGATDAEGTLDNLLRQSHTPWIRPDMAFIPCPPFTVIGFNTTTDVFITSATGRLAEMATGAVTSTAADSGVLQKLLADKGKATAALGDTLAGKLNLNRIEVSDGDVGRATVFEITTVAGKKIEPDERKVETFRGWIKAVFADPDSAGRTVVAFDDMPAGVTKITMTVPLPSGDLAAKVKP